MMLGEKVHSRFSSSRMRDCRDMDCSKLSGVDGGDPRKKLVFSIFAGALCSLVPSDLLRELSALRRPGCWARKCGWPSASN
eukprot:scaffold8108_cov267-Pinguiococcus_pyrenoidosus.AAC.1